MAQKRVAIYTRVSTEAQNCENQTAELERVAAHRDWKVVKHYTDHGISGAKDKGSRPGLHAMLRDAARGKFEMVLCWHVDRLARNLLNLLNMLAEMKAANVDLYLHQQAIDTSSAAGQAMFQMLGVFAEFERSLTKDRVMAGLARAKAAGKRPGPKRLEDADPERYARVVALLEAGVKPWEVVKQVPKTGHSTVLRILAELRAKASQLQPVE
jgi:DNA invertase Pin-like site-specific DNA recombinase